jgi:hypothetical protein
MGLWADGPWPRLVVVRPYCAQLAPRGRRVTSSPLPEHVDEGPDPMEPHDSTPIPPSEAAGSNPSGSAVPASIAGGPGSGRSAAVRLWALGAGAVAALVSWLLIETTLNTFKPKDTAIQRGGSTFLFPGAQERAATMTRNAELAMGLTGATLGLLLGLAGGLARPSARAGAVAAFLGMVLGAAAGAGAALAAVPLASHIHLLDPGNMSTEMASSLVVHGLPWAAVGAVGGLAFAIGLSGRARAGRALLGGLLGAVAGTFLYEIIGALALPATKTIEPVATTWGMRLLSQVLAVIPSAAVVAALVHHPADRRP